MMDWLRTNLKYEVLISSFCACVGVCVCVYERVYVDRFAFFCLALFRCVFFVFHFV